MSNETVTVPRELLQEAGEIIDSMATWFRNQPMGCPPAGTAQLQARIRKVLAAGVEACARCGAHVEHNCAAKACPIGVQASEGVKNG